MHNLLCQPASADLQPFVRAYAQREILDLSGPVFERVPARLEQTLEFQFGEHFEVANATRREFVGHITVVGSYAEGGLAIALKNKILSFGIFFQPVGLSRLFCIPPVELSNRSLDAVEVLPAGMERLHDQLVALPSFPSRVAAVEQFLRIRAARSFAPDDDLGCDAATRIFLASGAVRIRQMAAYYGLSLRQFERRFTHRIGISPKTYARVARFQAALDSKLLNAPPFLAHSRTRSGVSRPDAYGLRLPGVCRHRAKRDFGNDTRCAAACYAKLFAVLMSLFY